MAWFQFHRDISRAPVLGDSQYWGALKTEKSLWAGRGWSKTWWKRKLLTHIWEGCNWTARYRFQMCSCFQFFFFFFKYPSRKLMGKRRTKVRSSLWSKEIPTLFVNFQTAQGGVSHHSVVHRNKSYVHPGFLIGLMGPMRCYRSRELCEPNTQEPPSWVKWVWTVSFTPSQHHCEHGACRVM